MTTFPAEPLTTYTVSCAYCRTHLRTEDFDDAFAYTIDHRGHVTSLVGDTQLSLAGLLNEEGRVWE